MLLLNNLTVGQAAQKLCEGMGQLLYLAGDRVRRIDTDALGTSAAKLADDLDLFGVSVRDNATPLAQWKDVWKGIRTPQA
jgi:hypothetical protein